jgi:hypothetical protein
MHHTHSVILSEAKDPMAIANGVLVEAPRGPSLRSGRHKRDPVQYAEVDAFGCSFTPQAKLRIFQRSSLEKAQGPSLRSGRRGRLIETLY